MALSWKKNTLSWHLVLPEGSAVSYREILGKAFDAWDRNIGLSFVETLDPSRADIKVEWGPVDGGGRTLGFANIHYRNDSSIYKSEIKIDLADFNPISLDRPAFFYQFSVHEIGHAIGAVHSDDSASVMYPIISEKVNLKAEDIQAMQILYGPSVLAVAPIKSPTVFDISFYVQKYSDVAAAQVDPFHHYNTYGFKELRDPDWLFSTGFYFEKNPDVLQAGINPLVHYLEYGAAEGRDPHPLFDSSFYLRENQDVRLAGVNALEHWKQWGASEGRDPNFLFDTDYYIESNRDVADSGMNPLEHFMNYGWKEGRDPSGSFSTTKYLDTYGDVSAAGVNPLSHYLEYGINEGRDEFIYM